MKRLLNKLTGSKKALTTATYGEFRIRDTQDATRGQYFSTAEALLNAWNGKGTIEQKQSGCWCGPSQQFWSVYHQSR